mmetsp:Transcript_63609/g.57280  ORF Transcript_63609/g.57280 Transcript_63609/m.57280 type:complete len:137 (+) Transcript_63609:95-505(+)
MLQITAGQDALEDYASLKSGKSDPKLTWLIFKIDGSNIVTECKGTAKDAPEQDEYAQLFMAKLKELGVRYGVVDYNKKLCFVSWIPDNGKAAAKMKYATAREGFVQELEGISSKVQATDDGELTLDIIKEKCKSKV